MTIDGKNSKTSWWINVRFLFALKSHEIRTHKNQMKNPKIASLNSSLTKCYIFAFKFNKHVALSKNCSISHTVHKLGNKYNWTKNKNGQNYTLESTKSVLHTCHGYLAFRKMSFGRLSNSWMPFRRTAFWQMTHCQIIDCNFTKRRFHLTLEQRADFVALTAGVAKTAAPVPLKQIWIFIMRFSRISSRSPCTLHLASQNMFCAFFS